MKTDPMTPSPKGPSRGPRQGSESRRAANQRGLTDHDRRALDVIVRAKREPLTREDVLGLRETAELLGLPRSTLADLARRGEIPAVKLGRRWVFRRSLLDERTRPLTRQPSKATGFLHDA